MKKKELFSKKWFDELNMLSVEDRAEVIGKIISEKVSEVLLKHINEYIQLGMATRVNDYYNRYVSELDSIAWDSAEWLETIERLLSEIREGRLAYVQHYENMMRSKEES